MTTSSTTADPNWATTTSQPGAQQWQSQEQYQQYYNYYQAMSQAAIPTTIATTTATDPGTAYSQDYSKAWDEYYKAYYGQSYNVSASTSQYPTAAYSYDQYGYPNLAAPPPTYQYESVTTPATYQYSQNTTIGTTYAYTDTQSSTQTVASWDKSTAGNEKPTLYNSNKVYEHKPVKYDKSNAYGNGLINNNGQKDSYLERFPPPFDSGNNQGYGNRGGNYKGRESNNDNRSDNFRRPMRGYNNASSSQQGNYKGTKHYDDKFQNHNNFENQSNNNDYSGYTNNYYQNDSFTNRGRGSRPAYRARGGESSFRGRGGMSFGGRDDGFEYSNKRFSTGEYKQDYNNKTNNYGGNFNENNAWDNNYETTEESYWPVDDNSYSTGWNHQMKRPMMDYNNQDNVRPLPLMDIEVCPTQQSSIVIKRQTLINKWHVALKEIAEQNLPIQHYWTTIKAALSEDTQKLLLPTFIKSDNDVYCEVHLDDIFIVQAKGLSDDEAIEEAAKIIWKMFQHKLYVRTTTRGFAKDKVPVFCVSQTASGPVSVPAIGSGITEICDIVEAETVGHLESEWHEENPINDEKNQWVFDESESDTSETKNLNNACIKKESSQTSPTTSETPIQVAVTQEPSQAPILQEPSQAPILQSPSQVQIAHNFMDDDIFLVVDSSANEKDQSISILTNTAKFNKINIEYKHEKPENATHISQCLITINGQQFEKSEARDYLVAKREAADKAVSIFKLSCPQIIYNIDRSIELLRAEIVQSGKTIEEAACDWLKQFANGDDDDIYRLSQSFSIAERDTISKIAINLNLSTKSEGNNVLLIFKQYSLIDMKKRLLKQGYCALYQLVGFESIDNKSM